MHQTPTAPRTQAPAPMLRRSLRNRHVTMIALGGVIGAGLFVSSGAVLNSVGPGAWFSYLLSGTLMALVMRAIGEMAVLLPQARGLADYARIGLGHWAGFSVGWMYWYFWVIVAAVEAIAGANIITAFWPQLPTWQVCLGLIVVMTGINLASVKAYAEAEFWLASLKVTAIIAFVVAGFAFLMGWLGRPSPGLGVIRDHGGLLPLGLGAAIVGSVTVLFSFSGAEIATVAAAESEDPPRYAARATRQVTYRIVLFYLTSIAVIACIVPWDLPMSGERVRSPFAVVLGIIGIPHAETIMQIVVLTAVLSSLNSCLYLTSRVMFSLAAHGDAPQRLVRVTRRGVPARSILLATVFSYLSVAANYFFPEQVFLFLINSSGAICLVYYLILMLAQLRVRRRAEADGTAVRMRMWGHPWLSRAVIAWICAVLVFMAVWPATRAQFWLSALSVAVVFAAYAVGRRAGPGRRRPPPEAGGVR